ncbi:MAG: hypothetical protein OEO20_13690 [Gemmatimonadota bacterium]|nr:hypothetical protein [Gemmatimonadota bacterium]MDH3479343.1 hypothetical protein [Gemmatimonadota bacterium]MDH3569460.1 hypothetical protein [Gemmatimonadota bacterium]
MRHRWGLGVVSLVAATVMVSAGGCDGAAGPDNVSVRLENASPASFAEATLYTSEGPQTSYDVGTGESTPYIAVATAYRIATTEVVIEDDTLRLQVIDFVGEEPLSAGRYTYVISVVGLGTASPSLTQEIRKDT